ncbi:nephrocystin-4 isoform X3 [Betta splendens]|uniref:Nephrocystin-4 isoform X3 n=1 Tax=Betta splendens TaxID=158456 RepID=A0A6P7N1H9_BETSP|nr:nephrocystin-4 isoform X3 [Betta splendens]
MSSDTEQWEKVFERNRFVLPPSQTVRRAVDRHLTQSSGFQLSLGRLAAPHLLQETSEGQEDLDYQLRVTFFDHKQQHFFGRTWKTTPQCMKHNKISFNKVVYFHTSLKLPGTMLVLELVSLSPRPDGSQQAVGQGLTVLDLFANRAEAQDADGNRRLNLYHGSPRGFLHPLVKDMVGCVGLLKAIDGAHLDCVIRSHPALASAMHLLPQNVVVSGDENIPGLVASPTGDALLRPHTLRMLPFTLNRLTISLQPSLEQFESQLLQLINADCRNTKQPQPDGTAQTFVIQERRLHVGVHNGWCFLDNPQVVVLEPQASRVRARADSTSRRGSPLRDSTVTSSLPHVLCLRSSLEVKLVNHQALAIVFQLEYVFSTPIGRETTLSATFTSRAAFLQCLRWGIWCPFQEPADWKGKEIQLDLRGGAQSNPYGVMVYGAEASARTRSPALLSPSGTAQVSDVKDTMKFRLLSSLEGTASSPKASLRSKQTPRRSPPSSPHRGTPASPPESPPEPGLSLSQLAATSRYPTISHSSSALPWQQSFPSLLHPYPLASAHQLSHVACSAVSSIAHLEVDFQREGEASPSAPDEGDQLRELPFAPVHAPVITLGVNVPSSGPVSSRSSLARLHSAGFPDIQDCSGQVAEVLDPTEPVPFDPLHEEADALRGNLVVFQFLAFTRMPVAGVGHDWPDNIYFTFQFYRFPPVTSQRLKLLTSDKVHHKTSDPPSCILASINNDGSVNSGSPGLQVQFRVDDSFLRPGEKRWFLRYLALHTMHISVWDSSSLLLIGSTAIELKYLLRQGKSAVQTLHEVEVLTTDYVGDDALLTSAGLGHRSPSGSMTVHTVVRGRLHIRTGNIGCPAEPRGGRTADATSSPTHIIVPSKATSAFKGGSLSSRNLLQHNARNRSQPDRLESDWDPVPTGRDPNGPDGELRHKLRRMAAVRQREGEEDVRAAKVALRSNDSLEPTRGAELKRELHPTEARERSKAERIASMLSLAITTQHLLYASLGSAEYVEFALRNPFNVPQTVTIHSDDAELSVITDTEEWRYFKALTKTHTPLEENMFHLEDGAAGPRVYLRPKESVYIPLKYQSFLCDHTMAPQGPSFLPAGKGSQVAKKKPSNLVAGKTIKVTFKAEDGKPMAVCQLNVEPTPHVVDQTFRLYHPELTFLKKAIRLPPWHNPAVEEQDVGTRVFVRCSDPNIICQTRKLVPGEPQDVFLKVPGSPSPNIKMFFVMVFTDKWMAAPSQVWQIYVHFLERVDVSCVTGQRTCQSLVLKGKQAVRKVQCFSSKPKEIEVDPKGVFVLPPAAVQELQLKVQPWRVGSRFVYVNAVDVEQRRLVAAWLLCLNVHQPVLSKAFEVCVPAGSKRGSSKKITYTNPYTNSRTFLLRSDHPDLLQFKEDEFQIDGGESYTIGLRFAPSQSPGSVEILVYVNNVEEKTEETFCIRLSYS